MVIIITSEGGRGEGVAGGGGQWEFCWPDTTKVLLPISNHIETTNETLR